MHVKYGKAVAVLFLVVSILVIQACGSSSSSSSTTTYTVGGTVSGLSGTVVLQNNGGDDLSLTADGSFTFATTLADAATYAVTVLTQPTGQTCTVSSGSGTISGANVTSVTVTCGTSYEAVMTNNTGTQSGAVDTTVQGAAASSSLFTIIRSAYAASTSATGTLTLTDGTTVALTGTFDDPTLTLSGSGYTFTGTVSGDDISGDFTETDDESGSFAGFDSTTNTVAVYCGTWERPADPAHDCNNNRSGVWNIATSSSGAVTGVENRDDGTHVNTLTGTISGNTITITSDGQGGNGTATISPDGNTLTGTFVNWKGCNGAWTGTAGCQ